MRGEPNPLEFQRSIARELNSVKDRVRNLIGGAHWGEEGRYKEIVLRNVIGRFLPSNLSVGTGFVIEAEGRHGWRTSRPIEFMISRQIDVIIYDNTIPSLFSQGDFVILTPKSVRGIVEVKTRIHDRGRPTLMDAISSLSESLRLLGDRDVFSGIFSYEYDEIRDDQDIPRSIQDTLSDVEIPVKVISLGPDLFIRYWQREYGRLLYPPVTECGGDFYNVYMLRGLSFSYFISNLLVMCSTSDLTDMQWFLFPIEGTKEVYRKKTICINP